MDSASDHSDSSSDREESRDVSQRTTYHMKKQQENQSKTNQTSRMNRSLLMSQGEPTLTKKQCEARSNLISKNLNFNLPIKLDQNNFTYWKAQILPIVRAFDLEEFLFGPVTSPQKYVEIIYEETGKKIKAINDEFLTWKKIDQLLRLDSLYSQ